jgi:hypothetical protein
MRVTLAPGGTPGWLLVVNSNISGQPMRRDALDPIETGIIYRGANGLVTMCANCRRTRRAATKVWDWVPSHVEEIPPGTTHGLCPPCLATYFPEAI